MSTDSVSIAFAGSGGAGVLTAGNVLLEAAASAGWYAHLSRSAGPQIRGGESVTLLRVSRNRVESHDDDFRLLLAIDWRNFERFVAEIPLSGDSLLIGDAEAGPLPECLAAYAARYCELPLKRIAKGTSQGRPNMVALGVLAAAIGIPCDKVTEALAHTLRDKGQAAMDAGAACVTAGMECARELPPIKLPAAPAPRAHGE